MKKVLFVPIFIIIIAGFCVTSARAAEVGAQCFSNSDCGSNNCATKGDPHFAGICMPSSYGSSASVDINHYNAQSGFTTLGSVQYVQYGPGSAQDQFDSIDPAANWSSFTWSGWFCNQVLYRYVDNKKYYKATDGTSVWFGYIRVDDTETVILNAFEDMICKTAVQKKPNGSSCSSASECTGGYCVHGYCRSSSYYCGDSHCDSGESCSSCSSDCGSCGPVCGNGSCESGETCSSCSSDCGTCKKPNGSSCSSASECTGGYCVHGYCRSSSYYCGDSHCDSAGESCSNCSSDCGACAPVLKSNGSSCSASSECVGYCVHSVCRSGSTYCGDSYCDSSESCSSCSSDCGACQPTKKSVGTSCSSGSECYSDYCVHGTCRSYYYECGDDYCDNGESCSSCSSDCGACSVEASKNADGDYCNKSEECASGNCQNYRCCIKGKTCCPSTGNCQSGYYCSEEKHYCLPGKPDGQPCTRDEYCQSGNCESGICCAWGQKCCQKDGDCGSKEYCDDNVNYCKYRFAVGEKCSEAEMCNSGYCDSGTWTCAEKPPEFEKPPESEKPPEPSAPGAAPSAAIPEVTAGAEIEFLNLPTDISIKKGQEYRVSIVIENTSQREVILAEAVEVDDRTPFVVGINSNYLRVPLAKTTLLPGENVNNETRDILKALDMLVLTGRAGGSGEVVLRAVYFVNNRAKTAEVKIPVTVISENVNKEETASDIFNKQMVMAEKTATKDLATGEIKDAIFVEPEASEIYQATVNAWQKAQDQMEEAVGDLKDDFMGQITGAVKSDEIAFFETIKQLNEAATQKEITETALRALAPPTMAVGFDLANLVDALDKKHQQEKAFLAHFGATEFKTLPLYDEKGELIGSTKAIIKEENGKIYAIRIGDL